MHFSKSPRTTFQTTNYNPPPGFYTINQSSSQSAMDLIKKKQPQSQFLQCQRFPEPKRDLTGEEFSHEKKLRALSPSRTTEGFDQVAYNSSLKRLFERTKIEKLNYVSTSQAHFRQSQVQHKKTTAHVLQQFENLLNSQLEIAPAGQHIVDKQDHLLHCLQKLDGANQTPGPGAYDTKYDLVKPKVANTLIKETVKTNRNAEMERTSEVIYGKSITTKPGSQNVTQKRTKPRVDSNYMDEEYNLEKMFQRDLKKQTKQEVPPPGHYQIDSQFGKVRQLDVRNQCFDSRAPRFLDKLDELPGPGEYESQNQSLNGGYISKMPRKHPKQENGVPVGHYTVVEPKKPARKDGKYPSSFGSGSRRMVETLTVDTPGPGSYEVNKKKRGTKYAFRKKEPKLVTPQSEQSLIGLAVRQDLIKTKLKKSASTEKVFSMQSQKTQHMFQSSIERFPEKKVGIDLGPGQYDAEDEFTKPTFNRAGDLFARSERVKQQQQQAIGPGSYERDSDLVRRHFVRDIHF